jgi:TonB family protein
VNRRGALRALISSLFANTGKLQSQPQQNRKVENLVLEKFKLPFYPPLARQTGVQGKATATLNVAADGSVASVTDVISHPILKDAFEGALKEWRFDPGEVHDRKLKVEFLFSLKGRRDERIVNYNVSATLPAYFEIEVNPAPNVYS